MHTEKFDVKVIYEFVQSVHVKQFASICTAGWRLEKS